MINVRNLFSAQHFHKQKWKNIRFKIVLKNNKKRSAALFSLDVFSTSYSGKQLRKFLCVLQVMKLYMDNFAEKPLHSYLKNLFDPTSFSLNLSLIFINGVHL